MADPKHIEVVKIVYLYISGRFSDRADDQKKLKIKSEFLNSTGTIKHLVVYNAADP